jgi:hypothetical protein
VANPNDPLGKADERVRLNARLSALATQISGYVGDVNGLRDLQVKAAEINQRLSGRTVAQGNNLTGSTVLEAVST